MQIQGDNNITYHLEEKQMPNLPTDLILGIEFLRNNDCIINFKENIINIDGKIYAFEEADDFQKLSETTVSDKTKVLSVSTPSKREAESLIKDMLVAPAKLGFIKDVKHEIFLTTETPIFCKPFPVPHKLFEETKNELDRIMKLGVIRESSSPYCFPAFPILKKNGNIRLIID